MSFNQDPGEQAQINGADFALMCDEMKRLKAANAELEKALDVLVDVLDDGENNDPEHRCYVEGAWKLALNEARAALKKHKGVEV